MLRPSGAWLQTPVASFEDKDGDFTIVNKFIGELCAAPLSDEGSLARAPQCGCLRVELPHTYVAGCRYEAKQGHSPFDVVAWHGNYAPYKYDLRKYAAVGT
jgi:homogentisate 1,2-dioxygenase